MKILIFLICCISQTQSWFIETISSDLNNRQGWYIALEIETPSYRGPSIVHNNELYHYFRTEHHYSRSQFTEWVKTNYIQKTLNLRITDEDFLKYDFTNSENPFQPQIIFCLNIYPILRFNAFVYRTPKRILVFYRQCIVKTIELVESHFIYPTSLKSGR